jgi:glutamyl-tRNA reductase
VGLSAIGWGMERAILIVGLNHRTAPVEMRERLAFAGNGAVESALKRLVTQPVIDEAVIISTCNRVEIVACTVDPALAAERIETFLAEEQAVARDAFAPHLYRMQGREAVRHLFRVAASLDSMVVGEPQVLGQLKASYSASAAAGTSRTVLHRCFHKAFAVAKRVRRETGIATRAVSIASAAAVLARSIFEQLDGRSAMLIGAGEMSLLAARHLLGHGIASLIVTNRTFDRAVEVAREFNGTPVPFDQFPRYLRLADLVIGAAGAVGGFLLSRDTVQQVMRERQNAPVFLIDMAVPRCFDPEINDLDNVYLYDIDDLEGVAHENRSEREREAAKAEAIVAEEVESFWRWLGSLEVVPTIVALRQKVEDIRARELERTLADLKDLTAEQRDALDRLTGAIVKKILHGPITQLKRHQAARGEAFYIDAARRLFELAAEDGSDDDDSD